MGEGFLIDLEFFFTDVPGLRRYCNNLRIRLYVLFICRGTSLRPLKIITKIISKVSEKLTYITLCMCSRIETTKLSAGSYFKNQVSVMLGES